MERGEGRRVQAFENDMKQVRPFGIVLEAAVSGAPEALDYTESFLMSAQALLTAQCSFAQRRVVKIEPRLPFDTPEAGRGARRFSPQPA
jgi:hypothetical protein